MENSIVVQFKKQMIEHTKQIVFCNSEQWMKNVDYICCNLEQSPLNMISIFNSRTSPQRVLRLKEWKDEIGEAPIIKKGLQGIPIIAGKDKINELDSEREAIYHDAWDIDDFYAGKQFNSSNSLRVEIERFKNNYSIEHNELFWRDLFLQSIQENAYFTELVNDTCLLEFLVNTLMYVVDGKKRIDGSYLYQIQEDNAFLLYKNIVDVIHILYDQYKQYVELLGRDYERKRRLQIALSRSNRTLRQRIEDAMLRYRSANCKSSTLPNDLDFKKERGVDNYGEQ